MKRRHIAVVVASTAAVGALAGTVLAHPERSQQQSEQVLKQDLVGEPGKEVVATLYTLAPHTVPPGPSAGWHIHPDAQEVTFVVQGAFRMEIEGQEAKELKAGEALYLAPNVMHRGMNPGDETLKLYVVRIKPKDKPIIQPVPE
jgi:quercetin dioxygenase-like cupin family protein